jgi:hypothetical protein
MKKIVAIVLALSLAMVLALVTFAKSGGVTVVSDTGTEVCYWGYEPLPIDWVSDFGSFECEGNEPNGWKDAEPYQHETYLDPTVEEPFAGTGAAWISYTSNQELLPDYGDPSIINGEPNFATYLFRETFQVPATAINFSGTVGIAADNFGWLYLNGDPYILEPQDTVEGYNFRPGEQSIGAIPPPDVACDNVLAARVENGSNVPDTDWIHWPMGVLFSLELDYDFPETTLYAGKNIDVGTVSVFDDNTTLYIVYTVSEPWQISETHLHVANILEDIPMTKKGKPIPGQFDYSMDHEPKVTTYTYQVPLAGLGDPIYIAAHAVVTKDSQTETAWGDGGEFPGRDWATYLTVGNLCAEQ